MSYTTHVCDFPGLGALGIGLSHMENGHASIAFLAEDGRLSYDHLRNSDRMDRSFADWALHLAKEMASRGYAEVLESYKINVRSNISASLTNAVQLPAAREHEVMLRDFAIRAIGPEALACIMKDSELNDYDLLQTLSWISHGDVAGRLELLRRHPVLRGFVLQSKEHHAIFEDSPDFLVDLSKLFKMDIQTARRLQRFEARLVATGFSLEEFWDKVRARVRPYVGVLPPRRLLGGGVVEIFQYVLRYLTEADIDGARTADQLIDLVAAGEFIQSRFVSFSSIGVEPMAPVLNAALNNPAMPALERCARVQRWHKEHAQLAADYLNNTARLIHAAALHRTLSSAGADILRMEQILTSAIAGEPVDEQDLVWARVRTAFVEDELRVKDQLDNFIACKRTISKLSEASSLKEIAELQKRWHHNQARDRAVLESPRSDIEWSPLIGSVDLGGVTARELHSSSQLRAQGEAQKNCVAGYVRNVTSIRGEHLCLIFSLETQDGILTTLELDGVMRRGAWQWKNVQHSARGNTTPCPLAKRTAKVLITHLNALPGARVEKYRAEMKLGDIRAMEWAKNHLVRVGGNFWREDYADLVMERLRPVLPAKLRRRPEAEILALATVVDASTLVDWRSLGPYQAPAATLPLTSPGYGSASAATLM